MQQREIKFRAWNGKVMLHNRTVWNSADWDCERDSATGFPLMQYTGLKDKNGKEIYEGDICDDGFDNHASIEWSQDECGFIWTHPHEAQVPGVWCEVIGNVFEHPELLK